MDGLLLPKNGRRALIADPGMGVGTSGACGSNFSRGWGCKAAAASEGARATSLLHTVLACLCLSTNACEFAMVPRASEKVTETTGAAVRVAFVTLDTVAGTGLVFQRALMPTGFHVGRERRQALLRPNLLVLVRACCVCRSVRRWRGKATTASEGARATSLLHTVLACLCLSTNACEFAMVPRASEKVTETTGAAVRVAFVTLDTVAGTGLVFQRALMPTGFHVGRERRQALLRPNLLVLVRACHPRNATGQA
mmetsp:Transcript_35906/g.83877  ORF Transcript_35906/g.83877 Transcript_35906/m.83877 type:complete len:253 (+) Transcript_35906:427-1185(+)